MWQKLPGRSPPSVPSGTRICKHRLSTSRVTARYIFVVRFIRLGRTQQAGTIKVSVSVTKVDSMRMDKRLIRGRTRRNAHSLIYWGSWKRITRRQRYWSIISSVNLCIRRARALMQNRNIKNYSSLIKQNFRLIYEILFLYARIHFIISTKHQTKHIIISALGYTP